MRPVLIDVDEAASRLGYHYRSVLDLVDSGGIQWVWDVSLTRSTNHEPRTRNHRRELRFWLGEIVAPAVQRALTIDQVITFVVQREALPELRSVTVGGILRLRDQQMKSLVDAGELAGRIDRHSRWIERESVVQFLRSRWLGACA
jgi:hypothetical protein